jgi:F-type H+-transporting ATPase subunit delta
MEILETSAGGEGTGIRRLANVYAEALLAAAEERNEVEAIGQELAALVDQVFKNHPQFELFLASRAVSRVKKEPMLAAAFEGKCSDLFYDFIRILNRKDRLDLLRYIAFSYLDLYDVRAKRVRVIVRTAVALEDAQKDNLRQTLQAKLQLEPVLVERVDPSLLGGMIVQVGDHVFDSSVRSRIENIRTQLLARGSHEIQIGRDRFSFS